MSLKETYICAEKDHLQLTSETPNPNQVSEKAYLTQDEWFTLLNMDVSFVQDSILNILLELNTDKQSRVYIDYKEALSQTIRPDLTKEEAESVKQVYLKTKTMTIRTQVMLDILDEIITNS